MKAKRGHKCKPEDFKLKDYANNRITVICKNHKLSVTKTVALWIQNPKCHICEYVFPAAIVNFHTGKVILAPCSKSPTIDHIIPRKYGGTNDLSNLALACFKCNNRRGSIHLSWFEKLPQVTYFPVTDFYERYQCQCIK